MMTRKERVEAALRHEDVDRLPFWVKVFGSSYKELQPSPWREMGELKLVDYLDLDHVANGPAPVTSANPRVQGHSERADGRWMVTHVTPDGTLTAVHGFDEGSFSWHPVEFPIKSVEDIPAALHVFTGREHTHSPDLAEKGRERIREVGDRGMVHCGMGVSPLMDLIQHWIGPENT